MLLAFSRCIPQIHPSKTLLTYFVPPNMCKAGLALAMFATCTADLFSHDRQIDQACAVLESELPGRVYYPNSTAFEASVNSYNYLESRLRPNCILGPEQASEVQKAVQVLTKYPSVQFAVRSGGHNINKGKRSWHMCSGLLIVRQDLQTLTMVSQSIFPPSVT